MAVDPQLVQQAQQVSAQANAIHAGLTGRPMVFNELATVVNMATVLAQLAAVVQALAQQA